MGRKEKKKEALFCATQEISKNSQASGAQVNCSIHISGCILSSRILTVSITQLKNRGIPKCLCFERLSQIHLKYRSWRQWGVTMQFGAQLFQILINNDFLLSHNWHPKPSNVYSDISQFLRCTKPN